MSFFGHELEFGKKTFIMGILNLTPDSFSDGGDYVSVDKAVEHAKKMLRDGADIIDIGGESSRPGHVRITAEEELRRVIPVIKRLKRETSAILSLDTIRAEVAEEAVRNGIHMINDIWGFQEDKGLASVAAKYGTPVVLMHNQNGTEYEGDMIEEIKRFLMESVRIAAEAGVKDDKIILDPGLGFGKTPEQNLRVMSRLGEIKSLGYPVLLGASRKSMIGKILDVPPKDRDEGTIATTVLGIVQGMDIVRVHNVLANMRAAKVTDAIIRSEMNG
ncbi:dihydropteroate synthase [Sinanaerobacter chloroacetimidivorans]|uniref:Dihydropteroate synthase n=1 Tax=Sinanaerobacter chloroacetimidivorans TaxID=2818044 RepID=A0A8J8B2D7_9FIRM|nr:dihydropteroate synthase [Sinanaerobacter chloroacetimidivorans]MBR0598646.1 dihydropteroate synthase [Sinanaerobacter chloroacetimidivorans]